MARLQCRQRPDHAQRGERRGQVVEHRRLPAAAAEQHQRDKIERAAEHRADPRGEALGDQVDAVGCRRREQQGGGLIGDHPRVRSRLSASR